MRKFLIALSLLFSGCAQITLTGNITNVTVIKAQESKRAAMMNGSDLDARDLNLQGGDAEIPFAP